MFTRQYPKTDYGAIAQAILSATAFDRTYLVKTDLITRLSSMFGSDNPKFDPYKFWAACFNENDDPSKS